MAARGPQALLASSGQLNDDVAYELLPSATRWVVSPVVAPLWTPALEKLQWIRQRTEFIDKQLDGFLDALPAGSNAQCVLVGAGYDTRALRYARDGLSFYEVDLPAVLPIKRAMADKFLGERPLPGGRSKELPCDLNEGAGQVLERLAPLGFDREAPTLLVCEAVLFYLSPPAKAKLLQEFSDLLAAAPPPSSLVLTDNLAPFLRSPQRADAETYLDGVGLRLLNHDTLWGGAIQFVHADGKS